MTRQLPGADALTQLDPVFAQMAQAASRHLWGLPHLSATEKAIVCLAADLCHPHLGTPFEIHLAMAWDNGVESATIREILRHLGPYVGYPILVPAFQRLADLGVPVEDHPVPLQPIAATGPLEDKVAALDPLVPGLAAFTAEQFAQRWSRPHLSRRERAIGCLAVDILQQTLGASFRLHVDMAIDAGATEQVLHDLLQGVAAFGLARSWAAADALVAHLDS